MKIRILQSISGTNGAFAAGEDFVHAPSRSQRRR